MKNMRENALEHWMHRLMLGFRCQVEKRTKELGLNAMDAIPLLILSKEGSSYLVKLSKFIGHTHTSVLRHIDSLESSGYVVRKAHPSDRRMKIVELTDTGKAIIPKIKRIFNEVNDIALSGFSETEREKLMDSLQRIHSNLVITEAGENGDFQCDGGLS